MNPLIKKSTSLFYLVIIFSFLNQHCKPSNNSNKTGDKISPVSITTPTGSNKNNDNNLLSEGSNSDDDQTNNNNPGNKQSQIISPKNGKQNKITLEEITEKIKSGETKNIIIMTGAGISVNAGIPDFRSKNGLYSYVDKYQREHNLKIYNDNQEFFEINKFKKHPKHFFKILSNCGKIIEAEPTLTHHFFKLLSDKKILLKYYTQNIDCLEDKVNLPKEKIVRYHGSFSTSTCLKCQKTCKKEKVHNFYKKGKAPYCSSIFGIKKCDGILKPNVVFFGENVNCPKSQDQDFKECDLLIVIGTSLKVSPFNQLVENVKTTVPRILINMEKAGDFNDNPRKNDIFVQGDCDKAIKKIIKLLDWENDFEGIKKVTDIISSIRNKFGERSLPEDKYLKPFYDKLIKLHKNVFNNNIFLLLKVYENYFVNYKNRGELKQKLKIAIYNKAEEYEKIKELNVYEKKMEKLKSLLYMGCFWDSINNELSRRIEKRKSRILNNV